MRHRTSKMRSLVLILVAILLIPLVYSVQAPRVHAWGWITHYFIENNAELVFSDGSFFSNYRSTLYSWCTKPDQDYSFMPDGGGESDWHYLDADSRGYDPLPNQGKYDGELPWAMEWIFDNIVQYLKDENWDTAAELMGAICHFTGDATNPLHATYDYSPGGNHGAYETAVNTNIGEISIPISDYVPHELDNICEAALVTLEESFDFTDEDPNGGTNLSDFLEVDISWNDWIKSMTENRVRASVQFTANVWYTAMIHAGLTIQAPTLLEPGNGATTSDNTPTFEWSSTVSGYQLQYATDNEFTTNVTIVKDLTPTSYPPTTPLSDGTWYWRVRSGDNTTSVGLWSDTWQFTESSSGLASPSLISPSNGSYTNDSTPTFGWSAATGADNYELRYATDSEFTTDLKTIGNIRETQYTPTAALADDLWYWRVRAGTDDDNVGPWSDNWQFAIDTVAPGVPALTAYTPDPTNDSTPLLEWSNVSDAENYTLKYATDSGFTQYVTTITGITTYNYQITSPLADSTWYWRVKSIDAANNESGYSSYDSFTVDTVAPAAPISLSASPSGWTNTNSFTVSWTNPSGGSGIAGAYYKLESVPTSSTDGTYASGSGITSISGIAVSGDGSHTIYVWLKDEASYVDHVNRSSTTFYLDTSAPGAPSLLRPSDGVVTNENAPTFEWTNGSGADNHKLLVDNDTDFSSPEIDVTLAVPEDTYAPTTGLTDDNYSWRVGAIDNAGNENASPVWTFIVDTTPPSGPTPSSPADNSATGDTTPTFSWSSVGDPSGVTYKLQIDDESTLSEPLVFENAGISDNTCTLPEGDALADGAYYWRVRSVDGAGNENMSEVWSFTVDIAAPGAPTLLSPENNATVTTSIPTFNWSDVSDPSGVTYRIQADVSPADWASSAIDISGLTSSSYTPTTGLADGSYEWRALAVDAAGNASDWSSTWLLTISAQPSSTTLTIDLVSFTIQPENSITLTAVLTSGGNPLPDKLITWSPTAGTVSPSSGTTDAQGQVSTTYTAPDFETTVAIVASFAGEWDYYGSSWSSSGTIKTAPLELTLAVAFIPAGENHVFKFGSYPVPVFEVTITVDDNVENAEVTVEMVENVEVSVPPGMVHRYMKIETNIAPASIRGLLTRFKVSKSWVEQNDIGKKTIRVFEEVENEWRELPTRLVNEDSAYLYFETSMEGLSLFAITGGKAPIPILLYLALAVLPSAGGVGVAVLWVRSKRRSRLKRARYIAERRKKGKRRAT